MPAAMQVKLLRVLQERTLERLGSNTPIPVDCRMIAATKVDLRALAEEGRFRADLYYRLNVATVALPPLRERREDVPLLFQHFLMQAAASHGRPVPVIDPGRMNQLMGYRWPGNVRELRNVADRCVLGIESGAPPFGEERGDQSPPPPLHETVEAFERALIVDALQRTQGSLARSAEYLCIPKTTLHDKIKKYGL
jgi:two-component system C4-dicarboxylate transport response regulator DctD